MDLTSRSTVKNLLQKYSIRPSKGLGQNFLVDKGTLKKIIEAAELKPEDVVLEIGPGIGTLTQELAKKVKKVIAVEKDIKMVEILEETLKDFSAKGGSASGGKNIEIVNADILKLNTKYQIQNTKYKVVANLPYYIVSPVIRKFLESKNPPTEMILMVQKEVGQRICAKPPKMSLLAVSVQAYTDARIVSYVSKNSFWPQPKVDAAIIKIIPKPQLAGSFLANLFFKIVKAGFSQPRKQLLNNLSKKLKLDKEKVKSWLLKNSIQPTQRAETLTVDDWLNLTKSFVL